MKLTRLVQLLDFRRTIRLERACRELAASTRRLVAITRGTYLPVREDLHTAAAAIRNLRGSLLTIATYLATGRTTARDI